MNPSANGWINKLLNEVVLKEETLKIPATDFYATLKSCGFIYGCNIDVAFTVFPKADLTSNELCKVNLILSLYYLYLKFPIKESFVESVIAFYKTIDQQKSSFFEDLFSEKDSTIQLEKIINKRIYIDDNILTKNFNYFITNTLLFVDVLAFQNYLHQGHVSKTYLKQLEFALGAITTQVFSSKPNQTDYDKGLLKIFEASQRYQNTLEITYTQAIKYLDSPLEKQYAIDIACMASWSDSKIDTLAHHNLKRLATQLDVNAEALENSISSINHFYDTHEHLVSWFGSNNLVKAFYDNSSKIVNKLIRRNHKRLIKELKQSKELMRLLTQSISRSLTDEEQKKVQQQLLDIFKTIPSLAIFMLPGGAILLPLFIKFIPKLLPSAFDDNRIDDALDK